MEFSASEYRRDLGSIGLRPRRPHPINIAFSIDAIAGSAFNPSFNASLIGVVTFVVVVFLPGGRKSLNELGEFLPGRLGVEPNIRNCMIIRGPIERIKYWQLVYHKANNTSPDFLKEAVAIVLNYKMVVQLSLTCGQHSDQGSLRTTLA